MQTKIIKNKCSMTRGKKVATSERRTSDKHPRRRNVFVTLWKYVPENMPEVQLRRVLENLRRCHLFPAAIGVSAVTGFSKLQEPAPIEETRSRREKRCGTGRTNALRRPMPSTSGNRLQQTARAGTYRRTTKSQRETVRNWTHKCPAPSHAINNSLARV
jgi:hypothetical protein